MFLIFSTVLYKVVFHFQPMYSKFKLFIIFLVRLFDLPAKMFFYPSSKLNNFPSSFVFNVDSYFFSLLCFVCDFLVCIKLKNQKYLLYSSIFPNDLFSIYNFISIYNNSFLCFIYYFLKIDILFFLLQLDISSLVFCSSITNNLYEMYENGYKNSHTPSLNIFWPLHGAVCFQYSKLCYTLNLVVSYFLINKSKTATPLLLCGSSFRTYLPYLLNSKMLNVLAILGLIFEYLFSYFRNTDIVNNNFLLWVSLIFNVVYIIDDRQLLSNIKSK